MFFFFFFFFNDLYFKGLRAVRFVSSPPLITIGGCSFVFFFVVFFINYLHLGRLRAVILSAGLPWSKWSDNVLYFFTVDIWIDFEPCDLLISIILIIVSSSLCSNDLHLVELRAVRFINRLSNAASVDARWGGGGGVGSGLCMQPRKLQCCIWRDTTKPSLQFSWFCVLCFKGDSFLLLFHWSQYLQKM